MYGLHPQELITLQFYIEYIILIHLCLKNHYYFPFDIVTSSHFQLFRRECRLQILPSNECVTRKQYEYIWWLVPKPFQFRKLLHRLHYRITAKTATPPHPTPSAAPGSKGNKNSIRR